MGSSEVWWVTRIHFLALNSLLIMRDETVLGMEEYGSEMCGALLGDGAVPGVVSVSLPLSLVVIMGELDICSGCLLLSAVCPQAADKRKLSRKFLLGLVKGPVFLLSLLCGTNLRCLSMFLFAGCTLIGSSTLEAISAFLDAETVSIHGRTERRQPMIDCN
jgi:hypothetical protein